MNPHVRSVALALACIAALALVACSDDDGPTNPNTDIDNPGSTEVEFTDYSAALAAVAPPRFASASAKSSPLEGYAMWVDGEHALLGKVIGSEDDPEPMSLYRNLDDLAGTLEMMEWRFAAGEGESTGTNEHGQSYTASFAIVEPSAPIAIPASCRTVLGFDAIELDQVGLMTIEGFMDIHLGYVATDEREAVLVWDREQTGRSLFYAVKDLATDEIEMRGAHWEVEESETAGWMYHIATTGDDNTEFVYNMAWYSSAFGDDAGFACVQGSGDKDSEFGLRYHAYRAPWTEIADYGTHQQLFGPVGDVAYGDLNVEGVYPEDRADLIDVDSMFVYEDMPTELFASPFAGLE